MKAIAYKLDEKKTVLLNMSIYNFKSCYESLENKGEMNKQCCQNDRALACTMIPIRRLKIQKTNSQRE